MSERQMSFDRDVGLEAFAEFSAGKTIDRVVRVRDPEKLSDSAGSGPVITFQFTDGTAFDLEAWDYEGYAAGIYYMPRVLTANSASVP